MKPGSDQNVQAIGGAVRVLLVGALLAIGLATSARADTVYTYTGNPFTTFIGSYACPPECRLTGSITFALPLAPSTESFDLPTSWSFTDGNTDWNNTNTSVQSFITLTDAAGGITGWSIDFTLGPVSNTGINFEMTTVGPPFGGFDGTTINTNGNATDRAFNTNPGTWGPPMSTGTTVPEPTTLLLLGTGLLGLGTKVLRRKQLA